MGAFSDSREGADARRWTDNSWPGKGLPVARAVAVNGPLARSKWQKVAGNWQFRVVTRQQSRYTRGVPLAAIPGAYHYFRTGDS
jgi:hypothetical protein